MTPDRATALAHLKEQERLNVTSTRRMLDVLIAKADEPPKSRWWSWVTTRREREA